MLFGKHYSESVLDKMLNTSLHFLEKYYGYFLNILDHDETTYIDQINPIRAEQGMARLRELPN